MKKLNLTVIIIFISGFILFSCSPERASEIKSLIGFTIDKKDIDAFLQEKMQEKNISGLSMAVINDGQVVYQNQSGFAHLGNNVPVTGQTIFEGASMSKSLFGFFTMTFVDEGQLDLDKPLYQYLPYEDLSDDERYQKITARMVLSHRTGLPNWRENEPDKELRIKFEPGTDYLYSGEAYQYLAMVLAAIAETDWHGLEILFQQRVALPLGMEHTVFIRNDYTNAHKASPYDENGNPVDWENDYWYQKSQGVFGAAYSIHSEPIDFAKWMTGVMNKKILSPEAYHELLKVHSVIPEEEADYTLGLYKLPFPFGESYLHGGNNTGFTCMYMMNTNKKWGYVVFTNSEFGQELGEELLFYLLTGPDMLLPAAIGGSILIILLLTFVFLVKKIIRVIKSVAG
ncbi:MAG: serine hydrolase domain-containing protein [Cyclobacteriaceae bacterium]